MVGKTPIWLLPAQVRKLHALATAASKIPGAGPYVLESKASSNVAQMDVHVRKSRQTRLHDLVWQLLFEFVEELYQKSKGSNALEERLYAALRRSATTLQSSWPSDLRNLVNYAPGHSYVSVRKQAGLKAFGTVLVDPPATFSQALDKLENNVAVLSGRLGVAGNPSQVTSVLIDVTFALDVLARSLQEEIVARRHLDQRWSNARRDFLDDRFNGFQVRTWPYSV